MRFVSLSDRLSWLCVSRSGRGQSWDFPGMTPPARHWNACNARWPAHPRPHERPYGSHVYSPGVTHRSIVKPTFEMASFAVKAIDHVVLTVKSIPKTVDFYATRLGMKHETFFSQGVERWVSSSHYTPMLSYVYMARPHPLPVHASFTGASCSQAVQTCPRLWQAEAQPTSLRQRIRAQGWHRPARERRSLLHHGSPH